MLGLHHSTACKADELTATNFSLVSTTQLIEVTFSGQWIPIFHFFFHFFLHTHTHTYSGIHWLLVTTQENERKVRKSPRKRRKTCATIIVGNWTRNLSIGNRLHIPLHHMGHIHKCTHTYTHTSHTHKNYKHTHTHTHTPSHTHTNTHTHTHTSDLPIAEAMIANSYVRHSNLCWDYTIQQLARLMNWPPLFVAWYPPHSLSKESWTQWRNSRFIRVRIAVCESKFSGCASLFVFYRPKLRCTGHAYRYVKSPFCTVLSCSLHATVCTAD